MSEMCHIGAFIIRMGFGLYYAIITIGSSQNPILIIKAPTLGYMSCRSGARHECFEERRSSGLKIPALGPWALNPKP